MKAPGKITGYALKHLGKKPATVAYPFGKLDIDPNYRGKLRFHADTCIGCQLCVKDCPADALKVENIGTKENKKFRAILDLDHCIFCCQCVDSCRKGCLSFTPNIELAGLSREDMKLELTDDDRVVVFRVPAPTEEEIDVLEELGEVKELTESDAPQLEEIPTDAEVLEVLEAFEAKNKDKKN